MLLKLEILMIKRTTGIYEIIESIHYFIPYSLSPQSPAFIMDEGITYLYGAAMRQLGQLDEVT